MNRHSEGALDGKVVNTVNTMDMMFEAISGPTCDQQPPFQWSTSDYANYSHAGHPDLWNFQWQMFMFNA